MEQIQYFTLKANIEKRGFKCFPNLYQNHKSRLINFILTVYTVSLAFISLTVIVLSYMLTGTLRAREGPTHVLTFRPLATCKNLHVHEALFL